MRTRARGIADFRNGTGQAASAFGGLVGLPIEDRVAAGSSRLRPARAGRTNKPNSRPGRVGRGPGDGGRGIIAQNKPSFLPGSRGMGPQGRATRGKCAKQTQFSFEQNERQVL